VRGEAFGSQACRPQPPSPWSVCPLGTHSTLCDPPSAPLRAHPLTAAASYDSPGAEVQKKKRRSEDARERKVHSAK
jgi:hypothetical protein